MELNKRIYEDRESGVAAKSVKKILFGEQIRFVKRYSKSEGKLNIIWHKILQKKLSNRNSEQSTAPSLTTGEVIHGDYPCSVGKKKERILEVEMLLLKSMQSPAEEVSNLHTSF
jgi:hypothetical protein